MISLITSVLTRYNVQGETAHFIRYRGYTWKQLNHQIALCWQEMSVIFFKYFILIIIVESKYFNYYFVIVYVFRSRT